MMRGQPELYKLLDDLGISYEYHEHPPVATIEDAILHWHDYDSGRCKNMFFRNHKGNRHYLVIIEHLNQLNIHDLEKRLKQGKLTFASDKRLMNYLGVMPGSVSPFGSLTTRKNIFTFLLTKISGHSTGWLSIPMTTTPHL
jgi:Ala-tRNA(Pro) deacylase